MPRSRLQWSPAHLFSHRGIAADPRACARTWLFQANNRSASACATRASLACARVHHHSHDRTNRKRREWLANRIVSEPRKPENLVGRRAVSEVSNQPDCLSFTVRGLICPIAPLSGSWRPQHISKHLRFEQSLHRIGFNARAHVLRRQSL